MIIIRVGILSAGFTSALTLVGCVAVQQSPPTMYNGYQGIRLYDETAHYNAVKNLWFGLDDPVADQDKPPP
jgi:hypothetical protein